MATPDFRTDGEVLITTVFTATIIMIVSGGIIAAHSLIITIISTEVITEVITIMYITIAV